MEIIHAKESEFKNIIKDKLVLVDFYANWCGPCRMLGPVLEEIKDEIQIVKIAVDECEDLAREYGVMSIPNLLIMKHGDVLDTRLGFMPKDGLIEWIKEYK